MDSSTLSHIRAENEKAFNAADFAFRQGIRDPEFFDNLSEQEKRDFMNGKVEGKGKNATIQEPGALQHGREVGNPTPQTRYQANRETGSILDGHTLRLAKDHLQKMADNEPAAPEVTAPGPPAQVAAPEPARVTVERLRGTPGTGTAAPATVESEQNAGPVGAGRGGRVSGTGTPGPRRIAGEETSTLVPGEQHVIGAQYEIRELGDITPSHSGETFQSNPDYAHHNERDYSKAENQQRILNQSNEENFNPRYLITDNPDAVNGPPVIDERGNVLGGNSRAMTLQRVFGRNGKAAQSYRDLLAQKAAQFGIDPAQLADFKEPVLVRVAGDNHLASLPGGSKWAIRKTNVSGTAQLSGAERATADAGQLTPELKQTIADAIEQSGPDATLTAALSGKPGTALVNRLIAQGFFSEQERPALMDGKTGAITQAAKERISKALLGDFFHDSDQFQRFPASIKQKLERAAAPLASVATEPAWDLTPAVRNAVDLIEYADAHGIKNLGDVLNQQSMFGGHETQWTPEGIRIAEMLRSANPNDVVSAFRKYAVSKEPTMFGESTPQEAFDYAFGGTKGNLRKRLGDILKDETGSVGKGSGIDPQTRKQLVETAAQTIERLRKNSAEETAGPSTYELARQALERRRKNPAKVPRRPKPQTLTEEQMLARSAEGNYLGGLTSPEGKSYEAPEETVHKYVAQDLGFDDLLQAQGNGYVRWHVGRGELGLELRGGNRRAVRQAQNLIDLLGHRAPNGIHIDLMQYHLPLRETSRTFADPEAASRYLEADGF